MPSYRRAWDQLPNADLDPKVYPDGSVFKRIREQFQIVYEELDTLQGVNGGTPAYVSSGSFGLTTGTQGGIPYFSSGTTLASSALLGRNQVAVGGGSTGTPATVAMPSLASRYALTATTGTAAPIWTLATSTATGDVLVLRHSDGGAAFTSLTATTLTATAATFSGALNAQGATFSGAVRADSGLFVTGGATIGGALNAQGATFSGALRADSGLFVTGGATIGGALNAGAATFTGVVRADSGLFVIGGATVSGTFNAGAATFTGAINAQAATFTTIDMATLTATAGTFSGALRAGSTFVVTGGMTSSGVTNLGATTITGIANFSVGVEIFGAASLGSTLTVAGGATIAGVTNLANTTITGALNAAGVTVSGVANLGAVTITGALHAAGVTFTGVANLSAATVTGAFNANTGVFGAGVTVAGVTNLQAVTMGGTLNASGAANVFGAASLGSTLTVAGGVTVTGVTNLGAATITGALNGASATFAGVVRIPAAGDPSASKATNNTTTTISGISGTVTDGTATLSIVASPPNFDFNWAVGTTQSFSSGWPSIPFPVALVGGAGKGTLTVGDNSGPPGSGTFTDTVTVTGSAARGLSVLGATTLTDVGMATLTATAATFSGIVNASAAVNIFGAASLGSTLVVAGGVTVTGVTNLGAATITGALNAAGVTFSGVANFGAATFTGAIHGTNVTLTGTARIAGGLTVAGASTMAAVGMATLTATAATLTGVLHGVGATLSTVQLQDGLSIHSMTLPTADTVTIPADYQALTFGTFVIDGTLVVNGEYRAMD